MDTVTLPVFAFQHPVLLKPHFPHRADTGHILP